MGQEDQTKAFNSIETLTLADQSQCIENHAVTHGLTQSWQK